MTQILDSLIRWAKVIAVVGILIGLISWFIKNPTLAASYVVGVFNWLGDAAHAVITFATTTINGIF